MEMAQNNGNVGPSGRPESDFEIKNLLIDLVCENPLIYDKSNPDHFQTNTRNEVWHNISGILSIPGKCFFLISEHVFVLKSTLYIV